MDSLFRELKESETSLRKEKNELLKARSEIKILSGMLPICSTCKKIRDDQGYWQRVDVYIKEHADVDFTHGLCPDCAHKL